MNRHALTAAALAVALHAVPTAVPVARAADTIQRCEAADGTVGYTDKSCTVFEQRTVGVSAIVIDRQAGGTLSAAPAAKAPRQARIGRRSAAAGCARTPTQLQMDLRGALALGDVNRVAESYHWVGVSSGQARSTMDRLQGLASRPVLDTQYFNGGFASGGPLLATSAGSAGGGAGVLQLVLGGDGNGAVVDFDVHRYAGCYFVSF